MTGYLLDTNFISELAKPRPEPLATGWLRQTSEDLLYLSVVSVAESVRGAHRHPDPIRRKHLEAWIYDDLLVWIGRSVLPVTSDIAELQGRLAAELEWKDRHITFQDAAIASTALHHSLTVVTRNVRDFEHTGVAMLNPWKDFRPV